LSSAISQTIQDAFSIFRRYFLSDPANGTHLYTLPTIAAIFGFAGIALRDRDSEHTALVECNMMGFVILSISSVAWGGFQGLSCDRYLAWISPFWLMYIVIGVHSLLNKRIVAYNLIIGIIISFQILSAIQINADIYTRCTYDRIDRNFLSNLNDSLPPNNGIGNNGNSYLQYYMKDHKLYNIYGITTPEFIYTGKPNHWYKAIETIKHEPEHAFSYWLLRKNQEMDHPFNLFCGETVTAGTDHLNIYQPKLIQTDWSSLQSPPNPLLIQPDKTWTLAGMLDIGYDCHEKAYAYTTFCRIPDKKPSYGLCSYPIGSSNVAEVGLMIAGYEAFKLQNIQPVKDLHVTLRTGSKLDFMVFGDSGYQTSIEIASPLTLNILIDNKQIPPKSFVLNTDGYSEISFTIPATYINSMSPEIVVAGDHISYAYWFYQ
jgi:hypothetical protein